MYLSIHLELTLNRKCNRKNSVCAWLPLHNILRFFFPYSDGSCLEAIAQRSHC